MTKRDDMAAAWAKETQMFQRIAGTPETPTGKLIAEYLTFSAPRRQRELDSIRSHNIVAKAARRAGNNWRKK
jgi:hypothetical protein